MPDQTGQKFLINLSRRFNQPAEGRVELKRRQRPGPPPRPRTALWRSRCGPWVGVINGWSEQHFVFTKLADRAPLAKLQI
jgi:hypothetical protein